MGACDETQQTNTDPSVLVLPSWLRVFSRILQETAPRITVCMQELHGTHCAFLPDWKGGVSHPLLYNLMQRVTKSLQLERQEGV